MAWHGIQPSKHLSLTILRYSTSLFLYVHFSSECKYDSLRHEQFINIFYRECYSLSISHPNVGTTDCGTYRILLGFFVFIYFLYISIFHPNVGTTGCGTYNEFVFRYFSFPHCLSLSIFHLHVGTKGCGTHNDNCICKDFILLHCLSLSNFHYNVTVGTTGCGTYRIF